MSEPIWYYARGDAEQGPVSLAKLKSLLTSGRLRGEDLVWTEGMEDWQPASRVPGLLRDEPPAPPGADSGEVPRVTRRQPAVHDLREAPHAASGSSWPSLSSSRWILTSGLLMVLLAQGCDLAARRQVDRLQGMAELGPAQLRDEWDRKRIELEDKLRELRETADNSASSSARQIEINQQLAELKERHEEQEAERQRHQWRYDSIAARDAKANYLMGRYWRTLLFVTGSFVFTLGLLALGSTASGAERWLCWTMLAIVVYSIFVGGSVWNAAFSGP
jgi:hypothetical protein